MEDLRVDFCDLILRNVEHYQVLETSTTLNIDRDVNLFRRRQIDRRKSHFAMVAKPAY
jgi:hypothetical protein